LKIRDKEKDGERLRKTPLSKIELNCHNWISTPGLEMRIASARVGSANGPNRELWLECDDM
jgi:hypothetical protein